MGYVFKGYLYIHISTDFDLYRFFIRRLTNKKMKTYTIKQWFERVADPKLREELLANMKRPNEPSESLEHALRCNFMWISTPQGWSYWNDICKKAKLNQIELLPLPKIRKSYLLKRIESLEKQQSSDHVMIMDVLAKVNSNSFNIDGLYTKFEALKKDINEPINLNENPHFGGTQLFHNKENKIVFDMKVQRDGVVSKPTVPPTYYDEIIDCGNMDIHKRMFRCISSTCAIPIYYIGHYE
jgi:hypothetical protein